MLFPPIFNLEYIFSARLGLIYAPWRRVIFWSIFIEALTSLVFYYTGRRAQDGQSRRSRVIVAKYFGLLALTQALLVFFREQTSLFLAAPIIWILAALFYVYCGFTAHKKLQRIKKRKQEIALQKEKEKYLNP